jgi:general secretion pathway protein A
MGVAAMDRSHWGLSRSPFANSTSGRCFYLHPGGEEALARLGFLIEERRRLGLLLGEPGGGKSTLLSRLAADVAYNGGVVADVSLIAINADELLWQTAAELGANPNPSDPTFLLWRTLTDRVAELRYQRLNTLLVLDDAHRATADALAVVERLVHCEPTPEATLTIVLSANFESAARLGAGLLSSADLRVDLTAWSELDTAQYVQQALAEAGANRGVFDAAALTRLHELSGGIPRRVNQLADLSLLAGAGQKLERIDAATIEAVFSELSAGPAAQFDMIEAGSR